MTILLAFVLAAFGVAYTVSGFHLLLWGLWNLFFSER